MVDGLERQHGGGIGAQRPRQGTRFRISFTIATEVPSATRRVAGEAAVRGGSETVLVVEDDRQRRSAKRILEEAGHEVVTAADGLDALEAPRPDHGRPAGVL